MGFGCSPLLCENRFLEVVLSKKRDAQAQEAVEVSAAKRTARPWISRRTGTVLMVLLTVAVFVLVWLSAPPGADWQVSLKVAAVMTAAMWLVFLFVFTLSRWLHSR